MKIAIFIDGVTLFHGLKGKRLEFNKFKEWLSQDDEVVVAKYYNSVESIKTKTKFFGHVEKSGFEVNLFTPKKDISADRLDISEMDITLATDIMESYEQFDKIIIVSGKRNLYSVCKKLSNLGKKVETVGFVDSIYNKLYNFPVKYVDDFLENIT